MIVRPHLAGRTRPRGGTGFPRRSLGTPPTRLARRGRNPFGPNPFGPATRHDATGDDTARRIGPTRDRTSGGYVVLRLDGRLLRELKDHPVGSTLTVQAVFGAPDRVPRGRAVKIVKAAPK